MESMVQLTPHQEKALLWADSDGFCPLGLHSDYDSFAFEVRRPEYTAEILAAKGMLEAQVIKVDVGLTTQYRLTSAGLVQQEQLQQKYPGITRR